MVAGAALVVVAARTIVAVLHDLNHACRYATDLIVLGDGTVVAQGPPEKVITEELVETVFSVRCRVMSDPATGTPLIVPTARHQRGAHDSKEMSVAPHDP